MKTLTLWETYDIVNPQPPRKPIMLFQCQQAQWSEALSENVFACRPCPWSPMHIPCWPCLWSPMCIPCQPCLWPADTVWYELIIIFDAKSTTKIHHMSQKSMKVHDLSDQVGSQRKSVTYLTKSDTKLITELLWNGNKPKKRHQQHLQNAHWH